MNAKIPAVGLLCAVGFIVAGPLLVVLGKSAPAPYSAGGAKPAPGLEEQLSSLIGILDEQTRSLARQTESLDRHAERLDALTQELVRLERAQRQPSVPAEASRPRPGSMPGAGAEVLTPEERAAAEAAEAKHKAEVAAILARVRAEDRVAGAAARRIDAARDLEERLATYRLELGLTDGQVRQLRTTLEARETRIAEATRLWGAGEQEAALRIESDDEGVFRGELERVLGEAQVEHVIAAEGALLPAR